MAGAAEKFIERFSRIQVAVHITGALSILILYITGFPISFPEQLGWIPKILFGFPITMFIHRVAGVILLLTALITIIYHTLNAIFIREHFLRHVLPAKKDFSDIIADIKYTFGIGEEKPKYGKYSWMEKIDVYSVIFIDGIILGISGVILMMPFLFMKIIPIHLMLSFKSIHAGFAIISVVGILFHFYMAHLSPEHFPIDCVIFNGEMSIKEAEETHPEWVREIKDEGVVV